MNLKYVKPYILLFTLMFLSCINITNDLSKISKHTSIDFKVDSLMNLMTIEEKVGQMNLYNGFWDVTGPSPKMEVPLKNMNI